MIVILNGAPRSGKSSIAAAMQGWQNIGVDAWRAHRTPDEFQPGIGLRPGGERPDLEDFIVDSYRELFEEVALRSRDGVPVVSDLGIHDAYSRSLGIRAMADRSFAGLEAVWCHVSCSSAVNAMRRRESGMTDDLEKIQAWEQAIPPTDNYDLRLVTDVASPEVLARQILRFLNPR